MYFFNTCAQLFASRLRAIKLTDYVPTNPQPLGPQELKQDRLVKAYFSNESENLKIFKQKFFNLDGYSSIRNSYYQVQLPLDRCHLLRDKFVKSTSKAVRVGRILQLMDFVAATSSYNYHKQKDSYMVTVCVDDIFFFREMMSNLPIKLTGYGSYLGNSTIQIQVDASQVIGSQLVTCARASFLMAARCSISSKSRTLPKLHPTEGKDSNYNQRQAHALLRKQRRDSSKNTMQRIDMIFQTSKQKIMPIDSTKLSKALLMHLQDKNLHGKIFGGFIMREAMQLAWLCAHVFLGGEYPQLLFIDEIQFISSIQVGSMVNFTSRVVLVKDQYVHVTVQCNKLDPKTCNNLKTNDFRFTFLTKRKLQIEVIPVNQQQTVEVMHAKRAHELLTKL